MLTHSTSANHSVINNIEENQRIRMTIPEKFLVHLYGRSSPNYLMISDGRKFQLFLKMCSVGKSEFTTPYFPTHPLLTRKVSQVADADLIYF